MSAPNKLIEKEVVMRFFCFSSWTAFWSFIHTNNVPYLRINQRHILFDPAAVNDWIAEHYKSGKPRRFGFDSCPTDTTEDSPTGSLLDMNLANDMDRLIAEVARLKARVDVVEASTFGMPDNYVEGWSRAGKLLGIRGRTCKNRWKSGDFPQPCKFTTLGNGRDKPTWRRSDLVAYAEGK